MKRRLLTLILTGIMVMSLGTGFFADELEEIEPEEISSEMMDAFDWFIEETDGDEVVTADDAVDETSEEEIVTADDAVDETLEDEIEIVRDEDDPAFEDTGETAVFSEDLLGDQKEEFEDLAGNHTVERFEDLTGNYTVEEQEESEIAFEEDATESIQENADAEIVDSGECGNKGDNATWTLDNEGTLRISGTGKLKDYGPFRYDKEIKNVIIEDSITGIGSSAFEECSNIKTVKLPQGLETLGDFVFSGCSSLENVIIPSGVKSIGRDAFSDCISFTGITIPDSVTSIGDDAFSGCSNLKSITIGENVASIGSGAFWNCVNLQSAAIPASVTGIDDSSFRYCGLETITVAAGNPIYDSRNNCNAIIKTETNELIAGFKNTVIPENISGIGEYAFSGCAGLSSICIPDSVISIGEFAFMECSNLTNVTIGNSLTEIGNDAFRDCIRLGSIELPDSLTSIGYDAFMDCSSLSNVTVPNSVTSLGNSAFEGCSSLKSVTVGRGVNKIETYTFYDCKNLEAILFTSNVWYIGSRAFKYCYSLSDVYYTGNESEWNALMYSIKGGNENLESAVIHLNYAYDHIHKMNEGEITRQATCSQKGIKIFTCSVCGYNETSEIPMTSHTPVKDAAVAATAASEGKTEGSHCSVCGTVIIAQKTIPKLTSVPDNNGTSGNGSTNSPASQQIPSTTQPTVTPTTSTTTKLTQPMTVKTKKPTVKASKLKKKKQTIKAKKAFTVKNAKGKVTYKKLSGNKKITISKGGKITLKKGLKKGTYKIKVQITAAGNADYTAGSKTVKLKIKVE